MDNNNETKEKMTYDSRILIAAEFGSKRMAAILTPHVRLREGNAAEIYLREMAEAINSRLPADIPNHDVYRSAVDEIWKLCIAKHTSAYWFSLGTVIQAANKVASKYQAKYGKEAKAFGGTFEAERQAKEAEPKKPETIEGWLEKLKQTDDMIASGELNRGMGATLRRIPCAALARLGYEGDTSLPAMGETPADHLPETVSDVTQSRQEAEPMAKPIMAMDEGELNMRLLKAGMTAPKFDNQPDDFDDALPDNMASGAPSFDSL
jgi:hypothetical protein